MSIGMGVKDGFLFEIGRTLGGWLMGIILFIMVVVFILMIPIVMSVIN